MVAKTTICRSDEKEAIEIMDSCGGITVTPCSMEFDSSVTFVNWNKKGEELGTVVNLFVNHIPWWIGDWIIAGERYFPEKYSQALEETMYTQGRLRNCVYVCRNIESGVRRKELSFEHHYQVAKLPSDEQQFWLNKAVENKWTVRQLRMEINGESASVNAVPDPLKPEVVEAELLEKLSDFSLWWASYDNKSVSPIARARECRIAKDAWDAKI